VFQIPGDKGQWMLSVQHTADDIAAYILSDADIQTMLVDNPRQVLPIAIS
jgi:predicted metal-dependent phosphotriesterase family hydrolase